MQYISSGKFQQENMPNKPQPYINRPKTATPTPRRLSVCIIEHGRKSALAKENPSKEPVKANNYSKGCKTPR